MAQMFPSELPSSVLEDPRRSAERAMYDAFDRLLPEDMRVFYGVAWLAKRRNGDARDGEADFLLVDRERGNHHPLAVSERERVTNRKTV